MSYKPEVIADSSGQWTGNGLAFATEAEAREWVTDLSYRWTLVRDIRVVESSEPVNSQMVKGVVDGVLLPSSRIQARAARIEIFPNDNPKEREGRNGRINVSHRRTWILIKDGEFFGEYDTKKEAQRDALKPDERHKEAS